MANSSTHLGINVREAIKDAVRLPQLRHVLEKFHARLQGMDVGIILEENKITFSGAKCCTEDTACDILVDYLFRRLKFESGFDEMLMSRAMILHQELSERKKELLSDRTFLIRLSELLRQSRNVGDLPALAAICVEVHSLHGANMSSASLAEIANPEIVIELSKSTVNLLITRPIEATVSFLKRASQAHEEMVKKPEPAQQIKNPFESQDQSAEQGPKPRTPDTEPTTQDTENKTLETEQRISDKEPRTVGTEQETPIPVQTCTSPEGRGWLTGALAKMSMIPAALAELIVSKCDDAIMALMRLGEFENKYGEPLTSMVLLRNASALSGAHEAAEKLLRNYKDKADVFSADKGNTEKYSIILNMLQERLGLHEQHCHIILEAAATLSWSPSTLKGTLDALLSQVEGSKLAFVLLANPTILPRTNAVERVKKLLAELPAAAAPTVESQNRTQVESTVDQPKHTRSVDENSTQVPEKPIVKHEEERTVQPKKASAEATVEDLRQKLIDAGAEARYVDHLLQSQCYLKKPGICIENIEALRTKYGETVALVAIYKNPSFMIKKMSDLVDNVAQEVRRVREDSKVREKYAHLAELVARELGLEGEMAYPMISQFLRNSISEALVVQNLNLLIRAGVPKDELRMLLLKSPSILFSSQDMADLLKRYPIKFTINEEEVVRLVMALPGMQRPEGFVRSYVRANPAIAASSSLDMLADRIEYTARSIKREAGKKGVPIEFVMACLEKGMLSAKEIASAHQKSSSTMLEAQDAGVSGFQCPVSNGQDTRVSGVEFPVSSTQDTEHKTQDFKPEIQNPEHETQDPEPRAQDTGHKTQDTQSARGLFPPNEFHDNLFKDIMAKATKAGMQEKMLSRLLVASNAIGEYVHENRKQGKLSVFVRGFPSALCGSDDSAFTSMLAGFCASIGQEVQHKKSENWKEQKNGIVHVAVAENDAASFAKIQSVWVPDTVSCFLESRGLDSHEFAYAVLKLFGWMTSRQPEKVKREDYNDQRLVRLTGSPEVAAKVSTVLNRLIRDANKDRITLKSENELNGMDAEVMRFLKKANSVMLGG